MYIKECLQIVLENVDNNWNLVYEDGDMKVWASCALEKSSLEKDALQRALPAYLINDIKPIQRVVP